MSSAALITIHGMGDTPPTYADDLRRRVAERVGARFARQVDFRAVYYQSILQANEQVVWDRVDARAKLHYDQLRRFLLFGFGDAAGLENRKEEPGSVYELAQMEIAKTLLDACQRNGASTPLVFLSHSLGGQVLSNYIYDAQKARSGVPVAAGVWRDIDHWSQTLQGRALTAPEKAFLAAETAMGWISTGCNIPIFVAAHKEMTIIPIARPQPNFRWINIYDPDDVLGWPLQPLSEGYRLLVEDRAINAGQGLVNWILKSWNPLSHNAYWSDAQVVEPLAGMVLQLIS
jgi:hypothetical protein